MKRWAYIQLASTLKEKWAGHFYIYSIWSIQHSNLKLKPQTIVAPKSHAFWFFFLEKEQYKTSKLLSLRSQLLFFSRKEIPLHRKLKAYHNPRTAPQAFGGFPQEENRSIYLSLFDRWECFRCRLKYRDTRRTRGHNVEWTFLLESFEISWND